MVFHICEGDDGEDDEDDDNYDDEGDNDDDDIYDDHDNTYDDHDDHDIFFPTKVLESDKRFRKEGVRCNNNLICNKTA